MGGTCFCSLTLFSLLARDKADKTRIEGILYLPSSRILRLRSATLIGIVLTKRAKQVNVLSLTVILNLVSIKKMFFIDSYSWKIEFTTIFNSIHSSETF